MHVIHVKFTIDVNLCIVLARNINSFMLNKKNKNISIKSKKRYNFRLN